MPVVNYEHLLDMSNWTAADEDLSVMEGPEVYVEGIPDYAVPIGFEGKVTLTGDVDGVPLEIVATLEYDYSENEFLRLDIVGVTPDVEVDVVGDIVPFAEVAEDVVNEKAAEDQLFSIAALEDLKSELVKVQKYTQKEKGLTMSNMVVKAQHDGVDRLAKETADRLAEYIISEVATRRTNKQKLSREDIDAAVGRALVDFSALMQDQLFDVIDAYYGF